MENDDINEELKQFSDNRTYTISGSKLIVYLKVKFIQCILN